MARTNYSTYMAIKHQLLHIFKTETFERNKLPPESALAARLGISLVTLREALLMLALEGYITKRHGSGNYIHPSSLDHENRSLYFADCLQNDGYTVHIQQLSHTIIPAEGEAADYFGIHTSETVVQNKLLYFADDIPAILTVSYFPTSLLVTNDLEHLEFAHVHIWVHQAMSREVAHSLNDYFPISIDGEAAELLQLPQAYPIIASRQMFYDVQDVPILYNRHFFNPKVYQLKTLQNWDLDKQSVF